MPTEALASRFLSGYGIAQCSIDRCWDSLARFAHGDTSSMRLLETTGDPERALVHLSRLSWPDTRHVLFATDDCSSVLVNNSRNGSDYADYAACMAQHLQTRFARVVCRAGREWSNGIEREVMQYEARMFCLYGASGEEIRTVACADDGGRWSFNTSGFPHPVESEFPYDARRKRDRFTAEHLNRLIDAFGLQSANADTFLSAEKYLLIDLPARKADFCSIAEADDPAYGYYRRGLGWVAYMETHAASVIADFERCVHINPGYEPRVRAMLAEAYEVLGRR